MATSMRFFAAVLLISVGLTVAVAQPDWLRTIGVEVATFDRAANSSSVVSGPPPECHVRERRCLAKAEVVARLVARELDLFEAAARFHYLNHEPPEYQHLGYRRLAGETDEEKLCRQVILWVRIHRRDLAPESEIEQLIGSLEAILAARLCECGRIELPEWR